MNEIAQLAGTLTAIPLALFLTVLFFGLPVVGYQAVKNVLRNR